MFIRYIGAIVIFCQIGFSHSLPVEGIPPEKQDIIPKSEYLQRWVKNFTQIHEIPHCQDVPALTEEESSISKTCVVESYENILCSNIFLFRTIRDMCKYFNDNKDAFTNAAMEIVDEIGLKDFGPTPLRVIYAKMENVTKLEIPDLIKMDVAELVMDCFDKIATKAGFTKKKKDN